MTAPSLVQQVLDRCQDALFTGTIRVHTRQAEGEIWLLSGILERVRFGVSLDDEAMARLLAAETPKVELIPCLPNPRGGFKKGHPIEGELGTVLPVDLLRFCERHSLTCTLELHSTESHGEVVYRLGELVSVRCDAGTDRAVAQMLEWSAGRYRFVLPRVEVPTLAPHRSVPPPSLAPADEEPLPDSSAWRIASNEALKRKAEETFAKSQAEAKRLADEAAARRLAEEADEARLAEEADAKRLADEADAKRLADDADAKRLADEADAKRLADEADAKRLADDADAKHLADEANAKRLADDADAKHLADDADVKPPALAVEADQAADRAEAAARKSVDPKLTAKGKREAKAKRRLEEKKRVEEAGVKRRTGHAEPKRADGTSAIGAHPSEAAPKHAEAVVVRVRRVTIEYLDITVPVSEAVMKKGPQPDGSSQIDNDALFAEAVRLAQAPKVAWTPEGQPVVEVHPSQKAAGTPPG